MPTVNCSVTRISIATFVGEAIGACNCWKPEALERPSQPSLARGTYDTINPRATSTFVEPPANGLRPQRTPHGEQPPWSPFPEQFGESQFHFYQRFPRISLSEIFIVTRSVFVPVAVIAVTVKRSLRPADTVRANLPPTHTWGPSSWSWRFPLNSPEVAEGKFLLEPNHKLVLQVASENLPWADANKYGPAFPESHSETLSPGQQLLDIPAPGPLPRPETPCSRALCPGFHSPSAASETKGTKEPTTEMQVLLARPLAALLTLSLLYLGPVSAQGVNINVLLQIVNRLRQFGIQQQYAAAISLPRATCTPDGVKDLNKILTNEELTQMNNVIKTFGNIYEGKNVVAARARTNIEDKTDHAEWRLLAPPGKGQESVVQRLLTKTYKEESCLVFFTLNSPCVTKCVKRGTYDISPYVLGLFQYVSLRGAFVFQDIFGPDQKLKPSDLVMGWKNLFPAPVYRCQMTRCTSCNSKQTQSNPCIPNSSGSG
ncbi:uncharacterized protein LOC119932905 [Tachyglossus aculeatus]|uniref:uncharacterized protein LOC119932905 n=1 Tax=Tachyglossus aculeatus TaxID=9261 RepID=UPI0018F7990B|nr:uncharacterized protein LOC119932905 [Tachyglossus aculeatus]